MQKIIRTLLVLCISTFLSVFASSAFADRTTPSVWTAEKAVEFALTNSPSSRIAKIRIAAAKAKISQAESRLYPQFRIQSDYSQTDNPMYSFGNILNQGAFDSTIDFNDPGRTDALKLQAEIQYLLYDGGKRQANIAVSENNLAKISADYRTVIDLLAYEVVRSFQQIILAREVVETDLVSLHAIQTSLHVAKARYAAGDLLREQLLDLEVQEARASEDLIKARHTLTLAGHGFNNLLGLTGGDVKIEESPSPSQTLPEPLNYINRPELQAIEHALDSAKASLASAHSDLFPTINGFANYQYENGLITDNDGDSWMAGIKMSYSLFDGGLRKANIEEKELAVVALLEQKRATELQLDYELQQARQELQQAEKRLSVTAQMVNLAEEGARLSRARFKEGVILSSDLIDVETRLTEARLRQSRAKSLYRIAIANLRRVAGLPQFVH